MLSKNEKHFAKLKEMIVMAYGKEFAPRDIFSLCTRLPKEMHFDIV